MSGYLRSLNQGEGRREGQSGYGENLRRRDHRVQRGGNRELLGLRYALGLCCAARARKLLGLWSALSLHCASCARDLTCLWRCDGGVGSRRG